MRASSKLPDRPVPDCRVRIAAGEDLTYEEYSRALFDRAWERNQDERGDSDDRKR